jgi:hypothetical protein
MPQALFRFATVKRETDDDEGVIFVSGGQVEFDPGCECFHTTDKVMVFEPSNAYAKATASSSDRFMNCFKIFFTLLCWLWQ